MWCHLLNAWWSVKGSWLVLLVFKVMPSSRCVVQGCSNRSNTKEGISLHQSPVVNGERAKWLNFVRTHRVNFNPGGRFVVCSDHFREPCFERTFLGAGHGGIRRLKPGACPTIWKKKQAPSPVSARSRRRVSAGLSRSWQQYSDFFSMTTLIVRIAFIRSWKNYFWTMLQSLKIPSYGDLYLKKPRESRRPLSFPLVRSNSIVPAGRTHHIFHGLIRLSCLKSPSKEEMPLDFIEDTLTLHLKWSSTKIVELFHSVLPVGTTRLHRTSGKDTSHFLQFSSPRGSICIIIV